MFAFRHAVDRTQVADWLVAPLQVADTPGEADAIVVLGGGVTGTCAPNMNSLRRVLRAADVYHHGPPMPVVLSGGPSVGAPCAVAWTMEGVARRLGIPDRDLVVEASSRSTRENAERTAPILRALGAQRIRLVSDRLHLSRATASFRHFGFEVSATGVPVQEGHVNNSAMLLAGLREYVALAYYRWSDWLEAASTERGDLQTSGHENGTAPAPSSSSPHGPIVVLGASYAGSWQLVVPGAVVLNRGVAGQQSSEMLARFETDVVAAAPRAVILWGFINDIFRSPRESIDVTLAAAKRNYLTMIELAQRNGITVVLATEVTVRAPKSMVEPLMSLAGRLLGRPNYQDYINGHVTAMNAWLRALAARERLLLLDLQPVISDRSGRRAKAFVQDDGSHISEAGYALLSESAAPILARLAPPAPPAVVQP